MSSSPHTPSSEMFAVPEVIPIFPLPNVVFFPHTYLPLHIFEPRYRDMVKDIHTKGDCIGMALLKEGWESHYYQNPSIHELGCVGQLVSVNELSDGRYNIVLKGLRRCTYEEQLFPTSYRQAKVTLLPDSAQASMLGLEVRSQLLEVTEAYLNLKKAHDLSQLIATENFNDHVLVNSLSAGLDLTSLEKQFLLEAELLPVRARRLTELLKFKLADLHSSTQG